MRYQPLIVCLLTAGLFTAQHTAAMPGETVLSSGFESEPFAFTVLGGCQTQAENARNGKQSLRCGPGNATLMSQKPVSEAGLLEFWIKPQNLNTSYRIHILTASSLHMGSQWQQVGLIETTQHSGDYVAHRISIDDPARKFVRLDIESIHGDVSIDDINIERILLDTALAKNEEKIISGILEKLQGNKNAELQAEAFRTLGKNYASQLESQRQYLEYAHAIYSGITFVLASSERNKMSNPMAYASFRNIVDNTKRVASPIQQKRLSSMVKPFGDLVTASLNVVSGGTYAAFAEPFKSFLAATFDRSNYENADLSRKDRKFAEENGLKIYEEAERFLTELERELVQVSTLEQDLQNLLKDVELFRQNLDKHIRGYLQHAGMARSQENFSRVMSKEDQVRATIASEVAQLIELKALNHFKQGNNTELVQFMLKTSEQLDTLQEFKERFNQITSAQLTFYDRFERSIAPAQNPFADPKDKAVWEQHAQKARAYIQASKESFAKAYM